MEPGPTTTDAARRLWNTNADIWHQTDSQLGDTDLDHILDLLALDVGARVLDTGCGTGRRAGTLHTAGYHVVAVDVADAMVDHTARTIPGQVLQADTLQLPFEDASFDAVLCAYVLDFIADPVTALSELRRVVHDDGRLLLVTAGATRGPRRDSWRRYLEPRHTTGPLPWEVHPLLTHTGWHLDYEEGIFGQGRDHTPNPVTNPTAVDPTTWKPALQALADGWRFLATAQPRSTS